MGDNRIRLRISSGSRDKISKASKIKMV